MTFLEICQRAKREMDVPGTLSAVTSQTGQFLDIVNWCAEAYQEICRLHNSSWKFLRSEFTVNTVANDDDYVLTDITDSVDPPAAIDVDEFGYWWRDTFLIYLQSAGVGTQQDLRYLDYENFRYLYRRGAEQTGFPSRFTIRPRDRAILLGPTPDAVYVVTGEYQKFTELLDADADAPAMPSNFHMAIVWLAVQKYAGKEEDAGLWTVAEREYKKVLRPMEQDQLPEPVLAGPLA